MIFVVIYKPAALISSFHIILLCVVHSITAADQFGKKQLASYCVAEIVHNINGPNYNSIVNSGNIIL